ncbi:MAG TPA: TrkA C-terminal domain-containing protein, partial [Burkholderiaceae bacterium]|nr:TrkA C-terminal domain-containing protein [Burkholderiaceae bacterium]
AVQGTSITWLARKLDLVAPLPPEPDQLVGLLPQGFIAIDLAVDAAAPAAQRRLYELGLPSGVVLVSIQRRDRYLVPSGDTRFEPGDRIRALARQSSLESLRATFGSLSRTA